MTQNFNLALDSMTQNSNYLTDIQVSLDSFSSSMFDNLINWGFYIVQAALGFILAASLLIILGVTATHFFDLYQCRLSTHLGWITSGVAYFIIIGLSFVFFSYGGTSYQFCEFYGSLMDSSTSFSSYAQVTGPN